MLKIIKICNKIILLLVFLTFLLFKSIKSVVKSTFFTFLAPNWMLGAAFELVGPSHSKDDQTCSKIEPPRGTFSSTLELLRDCLGALGPT